MNINLNDKRFKPLSNSGNGEVSDNTIFHYYQKNTIIWAEYVGGGIAKGFLIGKMRKDNTLEFSYQHLNEQLEIRTGTCISHIDVQECGTIKLHESWQWTCKDFSKGSSVLIEI